MSGSKLTDPKGASQVLLCYSIKKYNDLYKKEMIIFTI